MCTRLLAGGFVLGALTTLITSQAISQDHGQVPSPEEMQAMMEAHAKATTPGEHHKKLDAFVGDWDVTTRVYWGGPGSDPFESKGRSRVEWALDGRFVVEHMQATFNMPNPLTGQLEETAFEGMGITGFDNSRQMYVGAWADNVNTHLLSMKGNIDPTGKIMTAYGEMDEPMLGVTGRMVKYVTRIVDANTHVFEIYDLHAGDDYKVMEITYSRL